MDPERWKKIEEIYHAAVEREGDDRLKFLADACQDDVSLASQVEALLDFESRAENFIEAPALEIAAQKLAKSQSSKMIGTKVNNYKVEKLLGKGGMGEVYLAQDEQLGRKIALKMLAPHLIADESSRARFLREARLASSLDHPNICTIHEIGESQNQCFISMQYVEGRTLSELIGEQPLDLGSLLSIGLQVTDALRTAHTQGVIHRDIKPANILINHRGQAKVLDFGLAKMLSADGEDEVKLTQTGAIRGTPAYMSPEQAQGEPVDHRNDIFSFGVVLYEMATGKLPFQKKSKAETMNAIINEPHLSATEINNEIPNGLSMVIDKALAKEPKARYQTMEELQSDLRTIASETDSLRDLDVPDGVLVPYLVPRRNRLFRFRRWILPVSIILVLALLISSWAYFWKDPGVEVGSLAVLPFSNSNAETEYLSEGMTESLINSLSLIPNLTVKARGSVFTYKGREINPQTVGQELKVQAILSGRVTQTGNNLQISLELIETRTGNHLWGKQYTGQLDDLVSMQSYMTRDVWEVLQRRGLEPERQRITKSPSENIKAYQLYLQGRYFWNKRNAEGLQKALTFFKQAIAEDKNYASAHSGIADCYLLLGDYGVLPPREALLNAKEFAIKAIELDGTLAEPHATLGYVKRTYDYDWSGAEQEFQKAIELNPNYATAHHWYALHLGALTRFDQALAEVKRAQNLDPFSLPIGAAVGVIYGGARQYDEALKQFQKMIEMQPNFHRAHQLIGLIYSIQGKHKDAILSLQTAYQGDQRTEVLAGLGYVHAAAGQREKAMEILAELEKVSSQRNVSPFDRACIFVALKDKAKAFEWLEKAWSERSAAISILLIDPRMDPLRDDPRFLDLLRRIGLKP